VEDYIMDHTDNLRERVEALEHHARSVERRVRWWRGIACSAVILGLSSWALPSSTAQTAKEDYSTGAMARRLAALEYKLVNVTGGTNEVVITGNLRIVNGLGSTSCTDAQNELIPNCPNGLGNLIVGYNEPRSSLVLFGDFGPDNHTGSHNIVVGQFHNFSSFGGLVVGQFHEISGEFASVSGGASNTASGFGSTVSGGLGNTASGIFSSVSGGSGNTASGINSSVSGGSGNTAIGADSSLSGGSFNSASGVLSSVSGGTFNIASGDTASISGGDSNIASGFSSSVSGGHNRAAPEQFSWAAGHLFVSE
jgi:trimeric autotransporter adhesin